MSGPIQTTGQLESISIQISSEVARALETVADPAAAIDRAIRRELRLPLGGLGTSRPVGRPRKHSVEDLCDCLGSRVMSTGEFQQRVAETLDISRASFFRLLERGRREWLFRQRLTDGRWVRVSQSQKVEEASSNLPDQLSELADAALSPEAP